MEIEVKTEILKKNAVVLEQEVVMQLNNIKQRIKDCKINLNSYMDFRTYKGIKSSLEKVFTQINDLEGYVKRMSENLTMIAELYNAAEEKNISEKSEKEKIKEAESYQIALPEQAKTETFDYKDVLERIAELLGIDVLWLKEGNALFNIIENLIKGEKFEFFSNTWGKVTEYLENTAGFILGDKIKQTGADYANFIQSSAEVFSKLLEDFNKKNNMGKEWENANDIISIFGAMVGLAEAGSEALDADGENGGEVIADWMNAAGELITGPIVEICKASGKEISDSSVILGEMGFNVVSQIIESADGYGKDGSFSFMDWINTGVDFSTAGLVAMVNSIPFVNIDKDETIDFLKNRASEIGTEMGEYILESDYCTDKFRNGNAFEKAAAFFVAACEYDNPLKDRYRAYKDPLYKTQSIVDSDLVYKAYHK